MAPPIFTPSKKGIFFSDVTDDVVHVLINTADNINDKYKVKEYFDAHNARFLQDTIWHPMCIITWYPTAQSQRQT